MFIIYTDGAYSSKRNQGGWAFLILHNDTVQISKFGGVKCNATNETGVLPDLKVVLKG